MKMRIMLLRHFVGRQRPLSTKRRKTGETEQEKILWKKTTVTNN